jgi:Tol biopolymer transport system component
VAFSSDGACIAYWARASTQGQLQLFVLDLASNQGRALDVFTKEASGMQLAMSPDGAGVAYLAGDHLVVVDVATGERREYESLGVQTAAFEFASGDAIDIVAGGALRRLDLASGVMSPAGAPPLPGGWRGSVTLSRSPDGSRLVAATAFGVFVQEADGDWRQVNSAGDEVGAEPARITWSADSSQFAYTGGGSSGLVVASADGSEAYELVRGDLGRLIRVLGWLADGRVVYAVMAQGL